MADVYSVIKSNDRLKENLQIILNEAVFTFLMKDETSVKGPILKAIEITNGELIDGLIEKIEENLKVFVGLGKFGLLNSLLSEIVSAGWTNTNIKRVITNGKHLQANIELNKLYEDFKSGIISDLTTFGRLLIIYKKHKNHEGVCRAMVDLCLELIGSHIIENTEQSSAVIRHFDDLIPQRSPTFIKCAAKIAKQRTDLLSKLDPNIRVIIELYASNTWQLKQFLTKEGISLAIALEYMKKLSS
jgi:hypothetical protein